MTWEEIGSTTLPQAQMLAAAIEDHDPIRELISFICTAFGGKKKNRPNAHTQQPSTGKRNQGASLMDDLLKSDRSAVEKRGGIVIE